MQSKDTTVPPIICDHNTPGEALYLVLPDGFVMLDGEDSIPRWQKYLGHPRCCPDAEPKGPIVTRMEVTACDRCDGAGRLEDGCDVEWERDERGEPIRLFSPRYVDCWMCNGAGYDYDWGPNVSLETVVAQVRGKAEVAA